MKKICSKVDCLLSGIDQDESNFYFRKDTQRYNAICNVCLKRYMFLYIKKHKNNKRQYDKFYYQSNKIEKQAYQKKFHLKKENRDIRNKREAKRRKNPSIRLRKMTTNSILNSLKRNGASKQNKSSLKYLPFTINELKLYLEGLFEPWMNWDNWGVYNKNSWNDDDQATWMWNIDHIIPQSDLPYCSMEDDNFKECWSLQNLRPYSAKINIIDGSNRIRHNKGKL